MPKTKVPELKWKGGYLEYPKTDTNLFEVNWTRLTVRKWSNIDRKKPDGQWDSFLHTQTTKEGLKAACEAEALRMLIEAGEFEGQQSLPFKAGDTVFVKGEITEVDDSDDDLTYRMFFGDDDDDTHWVPKDSVFPVKECDECEVPF